MAQAFAMKIDACQHAQLIKNQRHQFAQRRLVTPIPRDQQFCDGIGHNALQNYHNVVSHFVSRSGNTSVR
jgi:hypothetical protein